MVFFSSWNFHWAIFRKLLFPNKITDKSTKKTQIARAQQKRLKFWRTDPILFFLPLLKLEFQNFWNYPPQTRISASLFSDGGTVDRSETSGWGRKNFPENWTYLAVWSIGSLPVPNGLTIALYRSPAPERWRHFLSISFIADFVSHYA